MAAKITTINITLVLKSNKGTSKKASRVLNELGTYFAENGIPTDGLERHVSTPDCGSYFCTEEALD